MRREDALVARGTRKPESETERTVSGSESWERWRNTLASRVNCI